MNTFHTTVDFRPTGSLDSRAWCIRKNACYSDWANAWSNQFLQKNEEHLIIDWDAHLTIKKDIHACSKTIKTNPETIDFEKAIHFGKNESIAVIKFTKEDNTMLLLVACEVLLRNRLISQEQFNFLNFLFYPEWAKGYVTDEGFSGYPEYFFNRAISFLTKNKMLEFVKQSKVEYNLHNIEDLEKEKIADSFDLFWRDYVVIIYRNKPAPLRTHEFVDTLPPRLLQWLIRNTRKFSIETADN